MLQTDKAATSSTLPSTTVTKLSNQTDIVKRLEELNKWQAEQKKLLEAKQTMQRQMLGLEQRSMYQALGLQCGSDNKENTEDYEEYTEPGTECDDPNINTAESELLEAPTQKPKKPFLKRGQGLKQRFKIDPDELRLNNLPKYKYANAHPSLKIKPRRSAILKPKSVGGQASKETTSKSLDAQEQRFQQLLISSNNMCNSTPEMKSSLANSKNSSNNSSGHSSTLPKVRFVEPSLTTNKIQECPPNEGPPMGQQTHSLAWSKILDNQQIQPLPVVRKFPPDSYLPATEDDIFEMLEEKAKDGSFDLNSTIIKQFMQQRLGEKFQDSDVIPINEHLKTKRLQPTIAPSNEEVEDESLMEDTEDAMGFFASEEVTEVEESTLEESYPAETNKPNENRVRFSESHDTREYHEDSTLTDASAMSLANNNNNNTTGGESRDQTNPEFFEQFKQALFAALQLKADKHNEDEVQNSASDTTLTPKDSQNEIHDQQQAQINSLELQEKTEMIKIRLQELDKEIATFKENNMLLMKSKQDHELEKACHAQEQLELQERLKDEKIQMEIYLHDERMKLEEDKRKYEHQIKIKSQQTVTAKNKEIDKLREQINQLEGQLKTKESNHASAQARLRTQIKAMEKEEKRLHEQLDILTKENKRLENEIHRMARENNNKLLQEINKNIARLAPRQQTPTNFTPAEGPPVLPATRSMSRTIVATATANKNSKASIAPRRTTRRGQKITPPNSPVPAENTSSGDMESTPENSFMDANNPIYPGGIREVGGGVEVEEEEEDEDILQELQTLAPATKRHNIIQANNLDLLAKEKGRLTPIHAPPSSPTTMKREIENNDGSRDIWYPNGNLKKISADGMLIRMLYYNKDIKETNINEGTVKYYYAETNTWHTTYLDGLEILEFPNGQVEHRHKNGVVEVHYPNNSVKIIDPRDENKQEEWRFPDGTHLVQMRNGDKILSLPNGQKEIHTKLQKRREYPDGTVKIVYPDGSTETRYSNGRVRLKDKEGKLVMDSEAAM